MSSKNVSNTNGTGDNDAHFQNMIRNSMIFSYFITILAGITMNCAVLLAVYLEKALHNANKYFVACLAVSDLLVVAFSVTIRLHQYMRPDVPLSIHACRFWIWVDIFTELASITTLTIISIDRYFKVGKPFKYKTLMSTTKCKNIIMVMWLYSAVVASLGIIRYDVSEGGVHIKAGVCMNESKVFYIIAAFIGFFIPVLILIIMCTMMFRIVRQFRRSRTTRSQDPRSDSPIMPRVHVTGKRATNSNRRTVGIFSLVVCAFIVCWGPFFVLFLIIQYNKSLLVVSAKGYQILSVVCFNVLPYTNSFLNPIIYAYFDKSFNMAIKNLLLRMARKQPRSLQHTATSHVHTRIASNHGRETREHTLV